MCIIVPLLELPDNKYTRVYDVQRNFSDFITSNLHLVLVILRVWRNLIGSLQCRSIQAPGQVLQQVMLCVAEL